MLDDAAKRLEHYLCVLRCEQERIAEGTECTERAGSPCGCTE
jgi:hypothetical protein